MRIHVITDVDERFYVHTRDIDAPPLNGELEISAEDTPEGHAAIVEMACVLARDRGQKKRGRKPKEP